LALGPIGEPAHVRQVCGCAGLVLEGRREWVRAFPGWFERYLFAATAPARSGG